MPKTRRVQTPTALQVRIAMIGGEAFVTSRYCVGQLHVTVDVGPAKSIYSVEEVDAKWTRFEACAVTHEPSGHVVPLVQVKQGADLFDQYDKVTTMPFQLARLYVDELDKRPGAIEDRGNGPGLNHSLAREASEAALVAFERTKSKRVAHA